MSGPSLKVEIESQNDQMKINYTYCFCQRFGICHLLSSKTDSKLQFIISHFFVDPHVRSFPCFEKLFETSELFQLFIPYSVGTTNSLGSLHLYFVFKMWPLKYIFNWLLENGKNKEDYSQKK